MLGQLNIDLKNKVEVAIDRLQYFEPKEGYYLAFSGGKDSLTIKTLADMAGVKYDAHYNLTTVDQPELVQYIKREHKDVIIHKPELSMWQLIEKKLMPPTIMVRYCCEALKEGGGEGRFVITGVRWAESARRKNTRGMIEFDRYGSQAKKAKEQRQIFSMSDNLEKRRMLEHCQIKGKNILNPIVDWEDGDVWEFIKGNKLKYCKLYDMGYKRIGCIGCPMNSERAEELKRYPTYYRAYVRAFDKMLIARRAKGKPTEWKTGQEVMDRWLSQ